MSLLTILCGDPRAILAEVSQHLRAIFSNKKSTADTARLNLARWYNRVAESGFKSFVGISLPGQPLAQRVCVLNTAPGDSFVSSCFAASISPTAIGSYPARVSKPDISRQSGSEASTMITLFIRRKLVIKKLLKMV